MPSKDENLILDNTLLLRHDNDEHDILNEFLDQRVFDSLNANTPENLQLSQGDMEGFHSDLFLRLKSQEATSGPHDEISGMGVDDSNLEGFKYETSPDRQEFDLKADTDYLYITPNNGDSNSIYASPKNTSGSDKADNNFGNLLDDYDVVRKELSNVKFGNMNMNPCPATVEVADPSYLDFSAESMSKLPYSLRVLDLPPYSRVETQIKLKFEFSPAPSQHLLHVSQDLISKSKFCLQDTVSSLPFQLRKNMLFMDTYVLTSDLKRSCNVCSRCIKREQKRALRSKNGTNETSTTNSPTPGISGALKNNPNSWADESMVKKAIIFNCKEVMSFPAPSGLYHDTSKTLDFSARIICYCRHHKEQEGFRLLFVVKDYEGTIVAKHLSSAIMIMDRKKNSTSLKESSMTSADQIGSSSRSGLPTENNELDSNMHPLSPNSIDDSTSEALGNTDTNTDSNLTRGYKRKKLSFDDSFNAASNPMFNGGFSPLSNSDTNTSIYNMNNKNTVMGSMNSLGSAFPPQTYPPPITKQRLQQQLLQLAQPSQLPTIQKVIPAQGPIRGGIEVTLLGFNFRPGLIVKFGSKNALATHCWSESTIVTYLPPAAQPGQVLVSFENLEESSIGGQQLIFTYTDDTDRQLIELALQIVGLKMNGRLEDAKNIAKRIVGSDGSHNADTSTTPPQVGTSGMNQANIEWYDNAHKAVEKLSRSCLSTEEILINFLSLVDLPNCPIIIPNWQLCNSQGQALLHLATLKDYDQLVKFLITHGCKIDIQDNQGLTPLFVASMSGNRELINIFLECKSNWNIKLSNGLFMKDYCDLNVLDIFHNLESNIMSCNETNSNKGNTSELLDDGLSKSMSVDSLNSLYMMDYGKHISRMVVDVAAFSEEKEIETESAERIVGGASDGDLSHSRHFSGFANDSSDFADSEYDSDDNASCHKSIHQLATLDDDGDYGDDIEGDCDVGNIPSSSNSAESVKPNVPGLWQKVKNAVFSSDTEADLPSYDDLFPIGGAFAKPKILEDMHMGQSTSATSKSFQVAVDQDDAGITSDSSEDMVINYVNHRRKAVENDKMLLFFWLPVLVLLIGFSLYVSITGYKIQTFEKLKEAGRNAIGNLVVGNERLSRVFSKYEPSHLARA